MKDTTVHSLTVAKILLERAEVLCASDDRYLASSGLVVLQDALETIFYGLLIELGVDETLNLERKSFDELIGELRSANVPIPKSGTLKALNKQRVLTKHYAQVAEPTTVRNYLDAARVAIDAVTTHVIGKSIRDLFISDLLKDGEPKQHLKAAEALIAQGHFFEALTETRKAIFIEFEEDYSVYGWRNTDGSKNAGSLSALFYGGWRAPYWTKQKDWIERNVKVPTDYVQIDHQDLRIQAMELGIHTGELQNLLRLTPSVFRGGKKGEWVIAHAANFAANNATDKNARYCLDRAIAAILKKQEHVGIARQPGRSVPFDPPPVYIGRILFERPRLDAPQLHVVSNGFSYTIHKIVGGFDPALTFYEVSAESEETESEPESGYEYPRHQFRGFLQVMPEDA